MQDNSMMREYKAVKALKYKNETIANVFIADTFFKRLMGYMFKKRPHHEAILIKPCSSIHTFFMKFNIDVLFVDKNMKVLRKIESLTPGKIITPVKEASMVIEAPEGSFKKVPVGCFVNKL